MPNNILHPVGVDLGYWDVKARSMRRFYSGPSCIGTPDHARFAASSALDYGAIRYDGQEYFCGDVALTHSRSVTRSEGRDRVGRDEYRVLFLHALHQIMRHMPSGRKNPTGQPGLYNPNGQTSILLVTGLPVAFYEDADLDAVETALFGQHIITAANGRAGESREHTINVVPESRIVPQPFGTLFSLTLTDKGEYSDQAHLLDERVGILDIGGKTTNVQLVENAAAMEATSTSINAGAWSVVRALSPLLTRRFPKLEQSDRVLRAALRDRQVKYMGTMYSIADEVLQVSEPLADQIAAKADEYWSGGASCDHILITGGGALLIGELVARTFADHGSVRVVEDAQNANAVGFYRFARMIAG